MRQLMIVGRPAAVK